MDENFNNLSLEFEKALLNYYVCCSFLNICKIIQILQLSFLYIKNNPSIENQQYLNNLLDANTLFQIITLIAGMYYDQFLNLIYIKTFFFL